MQHYYFHKKIWFDLWTPPAGSRVERYAVFQQNRDLSFLHSVAASDYFPVFSSQNSYIYWNMVVIDEYRVYISVPTSLV